MGLCAVGLMTSARSYHVIPHEWCIEGALVWLLCTHVLCTTNLLYHSQHDINRWSSCTSSDK